MKDELQHSAQRPAYGPSLPSLPPMAPALPSMAPPGRVPHLMANSGNSAANYNNSNSSSVSYAGQPMNATSGPTPTLNQLLQSPNPMQRYHNQNDYSDYTSGGQQQPKEHNLTQQQQQAWNTTRFNQQQQQQQQAWNTTRFNQQQDWNNTRFNQQTQQQSQQQQQAWNTTRFAQQQQPQDWNSTRFNQQQQQQQIYRNQHHGYGPLNNAMMPPPSCYPTKTMPVSTPTGAAAAAQAAVMAAANTATNSNRPPHSAMYLRQHLQQKMYQPNSGPFSPLVPAGMSSMHSGGAMHGMPPSDAIAPTESSNAGHPLGPAMIGAPPSDASVGATTSVTQSITSPLSATPSLSNSIAEVRSGPQPPPIMDEVSQASTSSSQAEDSSDTPKTGSKPPGLSHPPTPNTLGSPGAASLSSFHDEFESVSSPSWPRTPASPVVNSQVYEHGHNIKRPDGLMKLYDMSDEPERRAFLDKFIQFQEEKGTPMSQCPTISKLPLDLYRIYLAVKERGGFVEVTRAKLWKECTQVCNIATSSSAAYTLRKQYIKHLLPFECKFDRGGIDPQPIISSLEGANRKKNKNAVPPPEAPFQGHSVPPNMDGYVHTQSGSYQSQPFAPSVMPNSEYPPPPPQPSVMPNSEYPPPPPPPASHQQSYPHLPQVSQMQGPATHHSAQNPPSTPLSNHNGSVSVQDPFADDIQHTSGYQSRTHPPSQSSVAPQSGATSTSPQSNEYSNYSYPNAVHNSYYNSVPPQQAAHPSIPPPQTHFADYNSEAYNRQTSQSDLYGAPPTSAVYPPTRLAPPSTFYNQQQGYDQHRADNRFEQTRPPAQDNSVYAQQQQQQSSVSSHQSRGQYSIGPSGQPSGPHQQNQNSSSNTNYVRSGSSPLGQYNSIGQQLPYSNSNQDAYKNSEISNYQNSMLRLHSPLAQRLLAAKISQSNQNYSGSQQPLYTGSSTPHQMGGMPMQKSVAPPSGPSPPQPQSVIGATQASTGTWHPSSNAQFSQKRHPDFMKQEQHYASVNNNYGSAQPSAAQYPPYSGANSNRSAPPTAPSSQSMWNREGQYRAYGPPSSSHMPSNAPTPPFGASCGPQSLPPSREGWDHMSSRVENVSNWPQNRFSPSQTGPQSHELYSGPTPYGGSHQINKMANFAPRNDQNRLNSSMSSNIPPPNKVPPHLMGPTSGMHQSLPPVGYPQHHPPHHHLAFHQIKKEIIFPPESVEATQPSVTKRRKLAARDLSSVEAWRLFMCLKSGLLAESTWALDVLSVLLYDDSTVLYFGLQHMPGMLEVLLEHYKRYLSDIFDGLFDDTEIGYEAKQCNNEAKSVINADVKKDKKWYQLNKDLCDNEVENDLEDDDDERCSTPKKSGSQNTNIPYAVEQVVLFNSFSYTYKSRDGKPIKIKNGKTLFIVDPDKKWDYMKDGFSGGGDHWSMGGGETTNHIQTHFECDESTVRFVKLMKKRRNCKKSFSWKMSTNDKSQTNATKEKLSAVTENNINCKVESDIKIEKELNGKNESNDSVDGNNNSNNSDKDISKDISKADGIYPRIRDSDLQQYKKRKNNNEFEEESYDQDEPAVHIGEDYQDSLTRRCLCLSTLIRNLSFVPGNDADMSKHSGLLLVLSRLLLLHHSHVLKKRNFDRSIEDELFTVNEERNDKLVEKEWWWDMLHMIRENTLVTIANLSGQLDLSPYSEQISLPLLDGLLHWAVCPSSYAQDTLPSASFYLSPQRLAFESLSKLSILDANVDLILATPPWCRIDKLYQNLARALSRHEDQTIREFSVVLLSNLSSADSSSARAIALTGCAIPLLISFVEQAEQSALQVANSQGINALRENPELMGTTLDMVRRSASTLRCISQVPDNRPLFLQHQQRLLALVMSQILDQGVAAIIADVIYECSLAVDLSANSDNNENANSNEKSDNKENKENNGNIEKNIENNESNENNDRRSDRRNAAETEAEAEATTDLDNDTSTDSNSANT